MTKHGVEDGDRMTKGNVGNGDIMTKGNVGNGDQRTKTTDSNKGRGISLMFAAKLDKGMMGHKITFR